jgi:hypothetical protein
MLVVSGEGQQGRVGTLLPEPLVARMVDEHGKPVPGQGVTFHVTSGGGSVFSGAATTDKDGVVRERWTLGLRSTEAQVVEARTVSAAGEPLVLGTFQATALPGEPRLLVPADESFAGAAGETARVRVRVVDEHRNPVPGQEVRWTAPPDGARPRAETSVTDAGGDAWMDWELPGTVGSYSRGQAHWGTQSVFVSIDVRAGAPARIEALVADCVGGAPGMPVVVPPNLRVTDAHGNRVRDAEVTLTIVEGGGRLALPGSPTQGTVRTYDDGTLRNPYGRHPIHNYWLLGPAPGRNVLSASLANGAEVRFPVEARDPFVAVSRPVDGSTATPDTWSGQERLWVSAYVCFGSGGAGATVTVRSGEREAALAVEPQTNTPGLYYSGCERAGWLDVTDLPSPLTLTVTATAGGAGGASASDTATVTVAR